MKRLSNGLQKTVFVIFALLSAMIIVSIVAFNRHPAWIFYPVCAATVAGLFFLLRFLGRHETFAKRAFPFVLLGIAVLLPLIQIPVGMLLEFDPHSDFGNVFYGAQAWAQDYTFMLDADRAFYFYNFPNNVPLMALLTGVFQWVNKLDGDQYFLAAVIVNSLLATLSIILCIDIVRRIAGHAVALVAAVVFLVLPPYYVLGAVFYTDAMTFIYPAALLWLYLVARKCKWWLKLPIYVIMAGLALIGFEIKATVVIMLIALILTDLIQGRWLSLGMLLPLSLAAILIGSSMWNQYLLDQHFEPDELELHNLPTVNWLVQGIAWRDDSIGNLYHFAPNRTERDKVGWQMLRELYAKRFMKGEMPEFYGRKMEVDFGRGTMGLDDFLDDRPWNDVWIQQYVFYSGEHYKGYNAYCCGVMLGLWILALGGAVAGVRDLGSTSGQHPEIWMGLVGIILFLLAWEMRDRYFSNYFSILIVAGVLGLTTCAPWVHWEKKTA